MSAALRTVALLLALCAFAPSPACAWWDGGHKIVAQIAYDELTPEERVWVLALLERNPTHAELFVDPLKSELGDDVSGESRARWYFSQASIWADLVREKKGHSRAEEFANRFNRETRHYTDAPIFPRLSDREALPQHATEPAIKWEPGMIEPLSSLNSLQTLAKAYAEIPDATIPIEDRAVDLLWIFHLVGDMHQPCHCAQLFTENSLPNGDRGANQVFIFGLQTQSHGARSDALHAFWDGLFNGETNTQADILRLTASAKALTPVWEIARTRATITEPEAWWREGIALAQSTVYQPLLKEIVRAQAQPHPAGGTRPPIVMIRLNQVAMDAYVLNARRIGQEQVITAGLRLAATLKELHRQATPQ